MSCIKENKVKYQKNFLIFHNIMNNFVSVAEGKFVYNIYVKYMI